MNRQSGRNNDDSGAGVLAVLGVGALIGGLFYLCSESSEKQEHKVKNKRRDQRSKGIRKYAFDCEMVGGHYTPSVLARVSIVDEYCNTVYDEIVKPTEPVSDYRTWIHGLTRDEIDNGKKFKVVQREVSSILSNAILIGHSVADIDLKALGLDHPKYLIRDVALYGPFQKYNKGYKPSLRDLARYELGKRIQDGHHDSVEDAETCMKLYRKVEDDWECGYM